MAAVIVRCTVASHRGPEAAPDGLRQAAGRVPALARRRYDAPMSRERRAAVVVTILAVVVALALVLAAGNIGYDYAPLGTAPSG